MPESNCKVKNTVSEEDLLVSCTNTKNENQTLPEPSIRNPQSIQDINRILLIIVIIAVIITGVLVAAMVTHRTY